MFETLLHAAVQFWKGVFLLVTVWVAVALCLGVASKVLTRGKPTE